MKEGNFSTSPRLDGGVRYKETSARCGGSRRSTSSERNQRERAERDRISARCTMRLHNLPADGRSWSVRFCDSHWKPIVDRFHYSAVGMAADSADTSLLTSAIEEDPTESPNAIYIGQSEILHLHCHHHHPRSKDVSRKCRRDQNGALLCDFDEVIDYVDYARLIRSWLSRTCNFAYKQREVSDSLLKFVTDIPPNASIIVINVLLINVSYMSSVVAIKCSFGYEYIVHPR
ncbi:hypothetical protein ALC53_07631 [Atta colombica]|uniref:Uncharacterized protein n=1 Tax=Atta colombica TaxID=520822 RepID=A0A195BCB3_9HYME|nr:hypothetical protein ALC53_07631 [Atta colombica]